MSFTANVKAEVCSLKVTETEKISELSAIISNISEIDDIIKISTENIVVFKHIYDLIFDIYHQKPRIIVRQGYNFNKNYLYILEINKNVTNILEDLSIKKNNKMLNIPEPYIIDDFELFRAYMRGLFIATGSINDPKTSRYHLEMIVNKQEYAEFIREKLNNNRLNSKIIKRENKYMIYIKEAERISDFLRIIKANNAVLYYEDIRIYRDYKNMTNRLNNCEQANIDKMILTANSQVSDIELIENEASLDLLPDKVKEVAIYRKKYPEVSLLELSEIITSETGNEITKSGIYHRMKKINQLADKIRNNQK